MTSFLFHGLRLPSFSLPLRVTLGLGISTAALTTHTILRPRIRYCDSAPLAENWNTYKRDAKVPVVQNGRLNPGAVRQISGGSVLGLIGGIAVGAFSKPLAFLIGILIFGAQSLASRGYNVIPTAKIQRYFKSIDIRSAVEDNVAFKLSFGVTFALASFAGF